MGAAPWRSRRLPAICRPDHVRASRQRRSAGDRPDRRHRPLKRYLALCVTIDGEGTSPVGVPEPEVGAMVVVKVNRRPMFEGFCEETVAVIVLGTSPPGSERRHRRAPDISDAEWDGTDREHGAFGQTIERVHDRGVPWMMVKDSPIDGVKPSEVLRVLRRGRLYPWHRAGESHRCPGSARLIRPCMSTWNSLSRRPEQSGLQGHSRDGSLQG